MYRTDALESLNEEQVRELALFAKNLLESTGVTPILTELNQAVRAAIEENTGEGNSRACLLSLLLEAYLNLNERANGLGRTIEGLTGIELDSKVYGKIYKEV